MYRPKLFCEDDLPTLHALMQEHSFAALITQHPETGLFATHMPFVLDSTRGPYGTLLAHMARANPHWRAFESEQEALIIFQGPHTYISPSWYAEKLNVPTWNYAVVHAYGRPRIIEDEAEIYKLLQTLTDKSEAQFEAPWQMETLPDDFVYKKIPGVVAFEMEITRLEGKFKMSQNRPQGDQLRVTATLKESQDPTNMSVAEAMEGVRARR
ncbi:MAG TPA: FMN-binding negative transcriptional regulator [Ktedonosporobacter sp.]|nr:FMN-binding negative transcriptional regulator [Ktedonosporobacter sp.]